MVRLIDHKFRMLGRVRRISDGGIEIRVGHLLTEHVGGAETGDQNERAAAKRI